MNTKYPTLAETLQQHGYLTAGFIGNTVYCSEEFGLRRGFIHFEDYDQSVGQSLMTASLPKKLVVDERFRSIIRYHQVWGRKSIEDINGDFLKWLSRYQGERPFFAFLNYYDAHIPYLPPRQFSKMFCKTEPTGVIPHLLNGELTDTEIRALGDDYSACIAYLDHQIGLLYSELERRGALENTLVVITSDHGEQLGEHGLLEHGNSLYMQTLHVPLMMIFPGKIDPGLQVKSQVSLRDLPATVMELGGFGTNHPFPGGPLTRHWVDRMNKSLSQTILKAEVERSYAYPAWYPGMKGKMKSIFYEGMHYIRNFGDGREELYNIIEDPQEEQDLGNTALTGQDLERFRLLLKQAYEPPARVN